MPFGDMHNKADVQRVLMDADSFATTLVVCLVDVYGTEMLNWMPETIRLETQDDFGIQWPQANFDRLMTGIALLKTDRFYKSLPDFISLCNVLSGSPATPGAFDPADVAECAWGITEALLIWPPDESEPFTEEIRSYIGEMMKQEGIISPPDILRIAIISNDLRSRVHKDFSDDADMYNAIWGFEREKTEDINDLVKSRLALLVNQLAGLNLINGDVGNLAKRMLTQLNAIPREGEPL